jgi:hypothetical protein
MPITDIGAYVPTTDWFLAHWDDVNTNLGGADSSARVSRPRRATRP